MLFQRSHEDASRIIRLSFLDCKNSTFIYISLVCTWRKMVFRHVGDVTGIVARVAKV